MTPQQSTSPALLSRPVRIPCVRCGRDLVALLVRKETSEGPACWPECKPKAPESSQAVLW